MTTPKNPSVKPTQTDSLFGMALAQAFVGAIWGLAASQVWDAGEMASAVYEDRMAKRTNGRNNFELGVKKSLSGAFSRISHGLTETMQPAFFQPALIPVRSRPTRSFTL